MLSLIIQISIISIIFIFLVHHLLCFFKTTLTVPKIKDLVNSPAAKYQHIFDTISFENGTSPDASIESESSSSSEYSVIDLLPSSDTTDSSMKDELKNFLKKQLNNDESFSNNSNNNNNNNNNSAYSAY
jgi:hypothetical protein